MYNTQIPYIVMKTGWEWILRRSHEKNFFECAVILSIVGKDWNYEPLLLVEWRVLEAGFVKLHVTWDWRSAVGVCGILSWKWV